MPRPARWPEFGRLLQGGLSEELEAPPHGGQTEKKKNRSGPLIQWRCVFCFTVLYLCCPPSIDGPFSLVPRPWRGFSPTLLFLCVLRQALTPLLLSVLSFPSLVWFWSCSLVFVLYSVKLWPHLGPLSLTWPWSCLFVFCVAVRSPMTPSSHRPRAAWSCSSFSFLVCCSPSTDGPFSMIPRPWRGFVLVLF